MAGSNVRFTQVSKQWMQVAIIDSLSKHQQIPIPSVINTKKERESEEEEQGGEKKRQRTEGEKVKLRCEEEKEQLRRPFLLRSARAHTILSR